MSDSVQSVAAPAEVDRLAAEVVAEITDRLHAGERVDVEAYIARHPELADRLRRLLPALAVLNGFGSSADPDGPAPGPGEEMHGALGDFRLLREVGRGGMGIVYEAEQISLNRRVALKVLPFAATLDPRQLQRFHNEARAAAGLHHTNIVPVHAVGCERGVHYYAMQFIEGHTLAEFIVQQRGDSPSQGPTVAQSEAAASASTVAPAAQATSAAPRGAAYFRRAAEWGIQAAEALDCAHALGVVHRDVKPANPLVDASGRLWVTAFGLAQVQNDARLTVTGDLVGTLRYMSPEQALAKRVVIDHRSDVYSLGATLYELLTLEPAFSGSDRQELLRQIAFEEPKRLRRVTRAVPAELETIVHKALEKNPAERYATAQALADDLRRWREDRPTRARRPRLVQRAQKWLRRHPAVVRLALLAAVASATGAWLLWQEQRKTQRALDGETRNRKAAEKAAEILASVFHDLDPEAEEKGGPALRVQLGERLDEAARILEEQSVGDPLTTAHLQLLLGNSLHGLGQYEKALRLVERARQALEATLGPHRDDALVAKADLGRLYHDLGQYDRAEALLQEALEGVTAQLGSDHLWALESKARLADLRKDQGKYEQAEALYKEVLQVFTAKLGSDDPGTLAKKNSLAHLYEAQGKWGQAEALYQEAVRVLTASRGADHPNTLRCKDSLAWLYKQQGQRDRALPLQADVVRALTVKLGADHPDTLRCKMTLAILYHEEERYDLAEPLMREVLQVRTATLGAHHLETLGTKADLVALYLSQQKFEQAEPLLREAVQESATSLGQEHPSTLTWKASLAGLYWRTHKLDESVPLFEEVVHARKAKLAHCSGGCSGRSLGQLP